MGKNWSTPHLLHISTQLQQSVFTLGQSCTLCMAIQVSQIISTSFKSSAVILYNFNFYLTRWKKIEQSIYLSNWDTKCMAPVDNRHSKVIWKKIGFGIYHLMFILKRKHSIVYIGIKALNMVIRSYYANIIALYISQRMVALKLVGTSYHFFDIRLRTA